MQAKLAALNKLNDNADDSEAESVEIVSDDEEVHVGDDFEHLS